ncbi:MAG: GGDEF domain-containing protein [Acetanaerobacterium sp.]
MQHSDNQEGVSGELERQLCSILDNAGIKTVFQPIVSLRDGSILGHEALSRGPADSPLQNPDALFGVAAQCGKLWELERLCRTTALESASSKGMTSKLFLNVAPNVIHDEQFTQGFTMEFLRSFNISCEDIIFEITEKHVVDDMAGFKKTIENYKGQSYQIAIDDAGAGYSGLNLISDIHPHYIKLDMNLVRSIDKDNFKKALVKCFSEFCKAANIHLIAEGIETVEELYTLIDVGVHYGQGFFLRRPNPEVGIVEEQALAHIKRYNAQKNHLYQSVSLVYIGNLSCDNDTAHPDTPTQNIYDVFLAKPALTGITIVENGKVRGIVTKTQINLIMSGQYGYSLHARRPVDHVMESAALVVDYTTPIDVVTRLSMSRSPECLYDYIVVTKEDIYCGIVTIKTLLEKTMEIEVGNAMHLNPLSGLPGNAPIQLRLEQCITAQKQYTVLYFDIDNFKSYNDVYGFENGDRVLTFVSRLLKSIVPQSEFVGHIGGDDFVIILSNYDYEELCCDIIRQFDAGIRDHYSESDRARGFIVANNRKGEQEQFPIMTISIAGLTNRSRCYADIFELTEEAGSIKKSCKLRWESCVSVQ